MHNGKYHTEQYKRKQSEKHDRLFGPIKEHKVNCKSCNTEFVWIGRKKTKEFSKDKFCSRPCANSIGGKAKVDKYGHKSYRAIAFSHHEKKCIICEHNMIVAVHHYDHNKKNNDPKNLVPLCPTHHEIIHSPHAHLIKKDVDEWVRKLYK